MCMWMIENIFTRENLTNTNKTSFISFQNLQIVKELVD
jgi:hypothetical protein